MGKLSANESKFMNVLCSNTRYANLNKVLTSYYILVCTEDM